MTIEISMYIIWCVIAILALVIEVNTQAQIGYAAFFASIGAIVPHAITKGEPIWIEIVTFFALWLILWIGLFFFIKLRRGKMHDNEDGYLAYIGQEVKATKGNDDEYGELKFSSKIFRFTSDEKIEKNDLVHIEKIKGVTFIVKKVTKEAK